MFRYIFLSLFSLAILWTSTADGFFQKQPKPESSVERTQAAGGERQLRPISERVKPPKQAIIEEKKRRALYIIQRHKTNITNIQDRINNIVVLLENASIDTFWLPSLIIELEKEVEILNSLEDEVQNKRVTKEKLRDTFDTQRKTMRLIMKDLREELRMILQSIK